VKIAARACSILPSTDKGQLELAVAVGRRAVKLGSVGWEWGPMALGMAEYRRRNDAPADLALLAAAKAMASIEVGFPPLINSDFVGLVD
jgi:hypothetical protein